MTARIGSKIHDNLHVKVDGDRLPNYIVKEIKDLIRQNKTPPPTSAYFDEIRFVVMDLETTGFYQHLGDEIISIGAVVVEDGRIKNNMTFHELIDPHCHVPHEVQTLTGIYQEMLTGCQSLFGVMPQFLRFIGNSVLVGHNIEFDLGFINPKLKKFCKAKIGNHFLDTITLSQFLGIRARGFALDDLVAFYGIEPAGRHTSLGDALMTADIFLRLLDELKSHSIKTLLGLEIALKHHARFAEVKLM